MTSYPIYETNGESLSSKKQGSNDRKQEKRPGDKIKMEKKGDAFIYNL